MEDANIVEPLQTPGESHSSSLLDRVLNRDAASDQTNETPIIDNVIRTKIETCINPSCTNTGQPLKDGTCSVCGFNQKERF